MPYVGPTSLVRWLGGRDLAGPGALTTFDDTLMAKVADTTVLGPKGAIKSEGPLGCVEYTASESGFLDDAEFSLRKMFGTAAPWISVVGHVGGALGAPCTLATDLRIKKKSIPPEREGFTKVALEYFLDDGGDVFEECAFVHGGARVSDSPPSAPYAGRRFDHGAATTGGAVVGLMIDADAVWRGQTWVRVDLRHSPTLATAAWPVLTGATLQLSAGSGGPAQLFVRVPGAINRHLACTWQWGPVSTFRVDRTGGYARGVTSMHFDGRGNDETLQPGDVFHMATDPTDYTVTEGGIAPTEAGSEFDVDFSPALVAQHIGDNATVTVQTKTDRSFKFIAAIQRL